jgi:Putative sensor
LNDSALIRFFGVVRRPRTWLGILFNWLAFPLGLFYFVFLVTGLSLGVGLVVVWVGIPILLVVAGAWWLFGAFERLQAHYLLGADVPSAPREWEKVDGIWAKLKAHFGSGATWKDLVYLLAKLPFGIVSTTLLITGVSMVFWFVSMPFFAAFDVPVINNTWVPPLWFGILCVPLGILVFFVALHLLNAWSWVCARWAEVMFRGPAQTQAAAVAPAAPMVSAGAPAPPAQATAPAASVPAVSPAPPAAPTPPPPATAPAPPASAAAPASPPPLAPQATPAPGTPAPQAQPPAPSDDETAS